jgi:hypothetical protein
MDNDIYDEDDEEGDDEDEDDDDPYAYWKPLTKEQLEKKATFRVQFQARVLAIHRKRCSGCELCSVPNPISL